jgi:ABC-type glycerol-3-phosphate transport system substrate-binding protein
MNKRLALVISMSALAFLAACGGGGSGGGGGSNDAPITQIPASANDSVGALAAFFVTQLAALFETTEPLGINNVGDFVTSDTTEPSAI